MIRAYLDTLALGQADPWLLLADDEDVVLTGSERVVDGVLDVDDVETTIVAFSVSDDTNTTQVTTTNNHGDHTGVELDEISDLSGREVDLDSVVDLDGRVGVSDTINPYQHCSCFSDHILAQRLTGAGRLTCEHHA